MRGGAQRWFGLAGPATAALLFVVACSPRARLSEPGAAPPMALEQGWERQWDDVPGAAWEPVDLTTAQTTRGHHEGAFFRTRLPAGAWQEPAIFFEDVESQFEARLDGQVIASYGGGPLHPPVFTPGAPWQLIRLPTDFAGKTLELHVTSGNPFALGPEPPVRLGSRSDLIQAMIASGIPRSLVGLLAMVGGLIALALWTQRRQDGFHLAFAAWALGIGFVLIGLAEGKQLVLDAPLFWFGVAALGRLANPVALLVFVALVTGTRSRPVRWLWRTLAILAGVSALALVIDLRSYEVIWRFVNLDLLVAHVAVLALLLGRSVGGDRDAQAMLVAEIVYWTAAIHDTVAYVHLMGPTPAWAPAAMLIQFAILGAVEARRLAQVYVDLARHTRDLEAANAKLIATSHELTAAIQARDEFLSVASHELRTPLSALNLQLELLGRPQHAERAAASIRRQVERLQELVGRLLDVTRVQARRLTFDLAELDLNELTVEVVARFKSAHSPQSTITFEGEGPLVGRWDRVRLDQVLVNLLSNAVKYGENRPIFVNLHREGDQAILTVADQGLGISAQDQGRIFQRFERAVSGRNYAGLGLGLWITRAIITELGGSISVESELGRGSKFRVVLPIAGPANPGASGQA